jgi:DNA replication and repair protein RecF
LGRLFCFGVRRFKGGGVTITRLSLTDFRSYSECMIAPGPGLVVLTGENGAGKTNILEAVSLLVPGRGLRGAPLSEIARQNGPGGFSVAARLGDIDLGTGTRADAPDRRLVRINGASASAVTLAEWVSALWLTPAMDRLFLEGASERRRFLDRLVLALVPGHASHASRYEAAMRQRNRLLSDDMPADPDWLAALEAQMASHGMALAEARAEVVVALSERLRLQPDGPFARASLALEGWTASADFLDQLRLNRSRDAAAGRALIGPHRVDLLVTHLAKDQAAALCSTGEQKALLLGIILAHAALIADRTGRPPILLLDEVAAHLDPRRRAALFAQLRTTGGQVWMTGTEAALFAEAGAGAMRLVVQDGQVKA